MTDHLIEMLADVAVSAPAGATVDEQARELVQRLATENRKVHESNGKLAAEVKRLQAEGLALRSELAEALVARDGFKLLLDRARRGARQDRKLAQKKAVRRG